MISFAWAWIYLLTPLPLLLNRISKAKSTQAIKLPLRVQSALQATEHQAMRNIRYQRIMLWLAWITLLTAIAQPSIPTAETSQPASGRAIVLAVDLSSSMERKDFTINDQRIDRLGVVKQIASEFILNRKGDRIGLVLFSTDTYLASPPSFDLPSIAQTLASSGTGIAGRTTAIGDAIGMAVKALKDDLAKDKAIILLSDGTNNAGSVEPESSAKLAKQLGIPVHTIGLGSDPDTNEDSASAVTQRFSGVAADLDEHTLKSVANLSGGHFFRARTTQELQDVYHRIDQLEGSESKPPPVIVEQPLAHYFTLLLLLIMLVHAAFTIFRQQQSKSPA